MKKWMFCVALVLALGIPGLGVCPVGLMAAETAPEQVEHAGPAPSIMERPVELDFSDAEFARADQPEQGLKTAGEVIVVSSVVVAVVVCLVVLIVLL